MGMDRNTVIGFVLLAGLLFVYLFISTKNSQDIQRQQAHDADSVARVQAAARKDSVAHAAQMMDTVALASTVGFQRATYGAEKLEAIENDVMRVTFTNKGGQPKSVELKHYMSADHKPVVMLNSSYDKISYSIITQPNTTAQTADFYFTASPVQTNADGSQTISFALNGDNGKTITHQYVISKNSYLIDFNVGVNGANSLFKQGAIDFHWQNQASRHERDIRYERQQSQIGFLEDGNFDYVLSKSERKFDKPVQWLSSKQQFFNSTLVAKNNFNSGSVDFIHSQANDSSDVVMRTSADFQIKSGIDDKLAIPLQLYYGPNEYRTLKNTQSAPDLDKMVNLGQGFYSFVRPINKWIVMPVFDFFKKFISSYGIVIALLTLFIRLLTSPLVYSSYLSGAKMKALRPEIDKMKLKFTDKAGNVDQQQVGVEQMKLFREAGVNPLGGCIPALLQIPIFFALYSFFSSNIALRGQSFLWAKDLSSYDDVINFGSNIWLIGNHISLFTITAVVTSFLISIYNMNMTPDQNNPALKYMPYIFPFVLFFIFNNLPSALTWYYTVSNLITLGLQFVIQNYIIDHDKILARLDENRKKPRTKPKWQERLEQMQETQRKGQIQQQRPTGKK
jgi:YidC/Oxa1 family membrane protein insertase